MVHRRMGSEKEGTQDYQRIYEEMKQYVQIKFVKDERTF